jgi:putative drug exporter of the RND superfamily
VAQEPTSGRLSRWFSGLVIVLGVPIVIALAVAAFASWRDFPGFSSLPETGIKSLLPQGTAAGRAETSAARLFGSSLLPRTLVVIRNPRGLSMHEQRRIVRTAVRLDKGRLPGFPRGSRALPYLNTGAWLPGAREKSTTAITYLGFPADPSPTDQRELSDRYADILSTPGARAEATGFIPGSLAQSEAVSDGLRWVEVATLVIVAASIGFYLRSLLAPLVTLAAAGLAYLIATGVVSYVAETQGVRVQKEVEPIIVVLLLGIVTDYSVFFLSGMRGRLRAGAPTRQAARDGTAEVVPIVFTAGLLVAAGLATLRLASIGFVQELGPAMAIVVVISLGVAMTFVPATMGILGRALFWPGLKPPSADPLLTRVGARLRRGVAWGTSRRLLAIPVAAAAVAGLVFASTGLAFTHLALTPIRGLTGDAAPLEAARKAEAGFVAGMIAPTELVLERTGIESQHRKLKRFGRELRSQPDIGVVIGAETAPLPRRYRPVFASRSRDAVRYFIAFRHHPYSSAAIADLARLRAALPMLLAQAHLAPAHALYAGDTALAEETTHRVVRDLVWVGLAAIVVNLVLLAAFLRSLVAPLLLVASSLLAITATFGLTTFVFRDLLGTPDLTYFVPLAVGVLLLSFGTDYNLFIVGRIWQEARDQPVQEAIETAVPRASRAISIAGVALALSFATLAIVPIAPFREFAVAIGIGVIIDTFVVRTLLIPAVLATTGRSAWWPSRRSRSEPASELV